MPIKIFFLAFVEFEDERDADDALKDLDDRRLNGSRIRLEKSKGCKDKYVDFQKSGKVRAGLKMKQKCFDQGSFSYRNFFL